MGEYELYVHPYCVSSIRVLVHLHQEYHGLPPGLSIRILTDRHTPFTRLLIPSVPALVAGDKILAIDPLEPELVVTVLEGDRESIREYVPKTGDEAVKRYTESIIASSYLMIKNLLGPTLPKKLINTEFYDYALRTRLIEGMDFRDHINRNIEKTINETSKDAPRITALNYLRDLFLVEGKNINRGDALDAGKIMLWMNAKVSIGRAYMSEDIIHNNKALVEATKKILYVLEKRLDKYMNRIIQEYEYIKSNRYIFSRITGH